MRNQANRKKANLSKARIVIVDDDFYMANLLRGALRKFGLTGMSITRNGQKALEMIQSEPVDILITEWDNETLDGVNLIHELRHSKQPRIATLPAVMLTAHATKPEVVKARDAGVTEFLAKPYTAKELYQRLERIIDAPRDFIICKHYVGPCRRRAAKSVRNNRRSTKPVKVAKFDSSMMAKLGAHPMQLPAQQDLREKIGLHDKLSSVITPKILSEAQEMVDSLSDDCLQWTKQDVSYLEQNARKVITDTDRVAFERCKTSLLSLHARSGTFDYRLQSDTAYEIYKFLNNGFQLGNPQHNLVLQKYVQAIKAFHAQKVRGYGGTIEQSLSHGLGELMSTMRA